MKSHDSELPDWIESRIEDFDNSKDLNQYHVAAEFVRGDRPYYNKKKMSAAVGNNVSRETVKHRLDELYELDVLNREEINNGHIYWLNREGSYWPIPKNVDPAPASGKTVDEWKKEPYVQLGAIALLVLLIGTGTVLVGTFELAETYTLPVGGARLVTIGLALGLTSYILLVAAGVSWAFSETISRYFGYN